MFYRSAIDVRKPCAHTTEASSDILSAHPFTGEVSQTTYIDAPVDSILLGHLFLNHLIVSTYESPIMSAQICTTRVLRKFHAFCYTHIGGIFRERNRGKCHHLYEPEESGNVEARRARRS